MGRPRVSQAQAWHPESLRQAADAWDAAAAGLGAQVDVLVDGVEGSRDFWTGSAADTARTRAAGIAGAARQVARAFVEAAVAARAGARLIDTARAAVLSVVAQARDGGFLVADDGTVSTPGALPDSADLTVLMCGGDATAARTVLDTRAGELTSELGDALARLGIADSDTAQDIERAFAQPPASPAITRPAGGWPVTAAEVVAAWPSMSQGRIAAQVAAMTPGQRQALLDEAPRQVGNTDGIPWPMRIAANRVNIADAILAEQRGGHPDAEARIAFYRGLLTERPDPTGRTDRPASRQILAFDSARSSLIELTGDLATARSVGVLIPGLNTTIAGSDKIARTATQFVAAGRGDVAMIAYLGGPFPTGMLPLGLVDAVEPRYALRMAPRLVAFSEDVNRTVDAAGAATGRRIPVTYIGHSYGGSILGTAEGLGLTADRTLYLEAAGAGVGVHDPGDWHNRNPDVMRFSMTAPGDPITLVQGLPFSPHGADPDELPGVVRLRTGRRLDGSPMWGPAAHSDVLTEPSDAWRNILAVITGDRERLHAAARI